MSSPAFTIRNPENTKQSTGPRTAEGKRASSRNSLRHGLASGALLITGEDPADWEALLNGFLEDWQPESHTERLLVQNLAKHQWLIDRAIRLQGEALAASPDPAVLPPSFAVLLRYQTTNERAYFRAEKSLVEWQRMRREFVSQEENKAGLEAARTKQDELMAFLTHPLPQSRTPEYYEKLRAEREAVAPPHQNSAQPEAA